MTIHAYTEATGPLPAYINLSERDPGDVLVTVRSRGQNNSSTIDLNHDQLYELAADIQVYLAGKRHAPEPAPAPAPAGGSLITFDDFVQHGRDNGANIVGGMPWHWNYLGHVVTHENDQCYLVGSPSVRFTPGDVLRTNAMGELSVERASRLSGHSTEQLKSALSEMIVRGQTVCEQMSLGTSQRIIFTIDEIRAELTSRAL